MRFGKANPEVEVCGIEPLPGTSNYFSGSDPKLWHTRIPQFAKVRYSNVYPGIDLIFYFRDGRPEYDVLASPGADARAVSLQIEGANPSFTREGDVAIKIGAKEAVRLRKPYAYQDDAGTAVVPTGYSLHHRKLSFALGDYDRSRRLVIDPALIFSTFITSVCSTCFDAISDIAVDSTGVYLTGQTSAASFPATENGSTGTTENPGGGQTFILKLDPTGSQILYSVLLSRSLGQSIAVDALGSAYVSGIAAPTALSGIPSFPLTSGVFSNTVPANAGGGAAFAAKLSPDGSTLLYSTLLQQPSSPAPGFQVINPTKIAVDSTGALYIGGQATVRGFDPNITSSWMPLPVTLGAFHTAPGAAFVLKLNPNASGLDYATYIDGVIGPNLPTGSVAGIAVDSSGDAFVAGTSSGGTFTTTPGAYQAAVGDGFVMELNPSGTAPIYSTFFGAPGAGTKISSIALDSHGEAIIAGSAGGSLPITPGAFCENSTLPLKAFEGFVDKFTADGSALVYGTTFCAGNSNATSVAVDPGGAAYVAGVIDQPADFQPFLLQPIQGYPPRDPGMANLALKFDTSGALQWSTFLGTNLYSAFPNDRIAVDATGAAYVVAYSTLPPTPNSLGPRSPNVKGQLDDAAPGNFLLKIAPNLGAAIPIVSPFQVSFASQNVGTASTAIDVQVGNFGDAPVTPAASVTGDFSETDNCSVAVPGGQKCDINVVFTPTVSGMRTGTLTVSFNGNIPSQTIPLIGDAGASAVSLSPTSLTFSDQAVGTTSGVQQVTVTNSGTGPLMLLSIQTSAQFAATNTCGGQIAAAGACTIQVTFTPSASGPQTGTLTIADNAPDSPQIVPLTGNAAVPPPPSIGLGVASGGASSATVGAGTPASYVLSIGGSGVSGTASLACTGAPKGAVCSAPATVPLDATSSSTFNVSVTTTSRSPIGFYYRGSPPWLWAIVIFGCFSFFKTTPGTRSPLSRLRFAPLLVLALAICSCGGGSSTPPTPTPTPNPNGTPAGTYTIVVTALSGNTMQTQNLTLTVQ